MAEVTNTANENLVKFETAYLATMQRVAELETIKKELEEQSKAIRKDLLKAMKYYNLVSVDNDFVTITRVAASTSKSINTKEMKLLEPDLYLTLVNKYPKVVERGESVRIKVKE